MSMDDSKIRDGLDVHIRVNGQRLEEYVDEWEKNPTIKYIKAESGASFTVAINFDPDFAYKDFDLCYEIQLDGHNAASRFVYSKDFGDSILGPNREIAWSHCYEDGRFWKRSFAFSDMVINEEDIEDLEESSRKGLGGLGEISVEIRRIKIHSKSEALANSIPNLFSELDQYAEVPKKALKDCAVSHRTKLGERQATETPTLVTTENIDPHPFAVYTFRYRSAEGLKCLGLIPRTPEPVPLEQRPVEQLTPEEMMKEVVRLREQVQKHEEIKRESKSPEVQPKREPGYRTQWEDGDDLIFIEDRPAKRQKRNPEDAPETVDLTGE
ncbi:hypothetical protein IWZ01DRAFT_538095 [Phyllosticta capitalensis]